MIQMSCYKLCAYIVCRSSVCKGTGAGKWRVRGLSPGRHKLQTKDGMCANSRGRRALPKYPWARYPIPKICSIGPCGKLATHLGVFPAVPICSSDKLQEPIKLTKWINKYRFSVFFFTLWGNDRELLLISFIFFEGVTWGKVVSLYAVAGALAVDCVRHGHPAMVHTIVDCMGEFVRKSLISWLKRRGGWVRGNLCFQTLTHFNWLCWGTQNSTLVKKQNVVEVEC